MKIEDIVELMREMNRHGINVVDCTLNGEHVRLEKDKADQAERAGSAALLSNELALDQASEDHPKDGETVYTITAPVVGIFYAAPSPEDDPFVKVGSQIEAGTTVCIIEAMKLMNEVTSEYSGHVKEILVKNGERVEFGQPLMKIGGHSNDEPSGH
jgi:acetyl-CoA carboxylase biotin carboxyl carrier protein